MKQIIAIRILPNISESNGNQTTKFDSLKFDQLINKSFDKGNADLYYWYIQLPVIEMREQNSCYQLCSLN